MHLNCKVDVFNDLYAWWHGNIKVAEYLLTVLILGRLA